MTSKKDQDLQRSSKKIRVRLSLKDFDFDDATIVEKAAMLPLEHINHYPTERLKWFAEQLKIPEIPTDRNGLVFRIVDYIDKRRGIVETEAAFDSNLPILYFSHVEDNLRYVYKCNNSALQYSATFNQNGTVRTIQHFFHPNVYFSYSFNDNGKLKYRVAMLDKFCYCESWRYDETAKISCEFGEIEIVCDLARQKRGFACLKQMNEDIGISCGLIPLIAGLVADYIYPISQEEERIDWPGLRQQN